MTSVGLVGDTHVPEAADDLPAAAYAALDGCDRILHCGDLHTIAVVDRLDAVAPTIVSRGNGDTATATRRRPGVPVDPRVVDHLVTGIGGFRVGLTHDLEIAEHLDDDGVRALLLRVFGEPVDIAVAGHTHVPMLRGLDDGTVLVNPGSPTMPHGYLGIVGTLGILNVATDRFDVTILDLATGVAQLELTGPCVHALQLGPRPTGGR